MHEVCSTLWGDEAVSWRKLGHDEHRATAVGGGEESAAKLGGHRHVGWSGYWYLNRMRYTW